MIVKGWLGFGDRLESLKMCVSYALEHNLQIYVDWRDPMWSHGDENFYTYFKLINMPVLNSLADIPADATYHPPHWKGRLDDQITYNYIQANKDAGLDIGVLTGTYNADVVVCSSNGYRTLYPDSTFFANVFRVVDSRVLQQVQYHKSRYPVASSWGVHIRGTDRLRSNKRTLSVQSLVSYFTMMGGMNKPHMVAVSDDKENLDLWKRFYPQTYIVSELSVQQTSLKGNHNLDKSAIAGSRDSMNVDLLIDFFILASCERIFSTIKGSRFMVEAQRLHPHVGRMLSL
jgi:hypothetical protein